jgi:hypothetical protein
MPAKPESKLQKKIQDRLEARGAYVAKIHGGIYSSGVPDLLACYRGHFLGLEVKTPDNKSGATKLQKGQLRAIKRARGYGYVVRSVEAVDKICDAVDRKLDGQE